MAGEMPQEGRGAMETPTEGAEEEAEGEEEGERRSWRMRRTRRTRRQLLESKAAVRGRQPERAPAATG